MIAQSRNARLALAAINREETKGIPTWLLHIMEHSIIERIADARPGEYSLDPHNVYIRMLKNAGCCMVDQYLAENPLSMGDRGYEAAAHTATTGGVASLDGIRIDGPDDVAEHIERFAIPRVRDRIASFDGEQVEKQVVWEESRISAMLGEDMLKAGYAHLRLPALHYGTYGYEPYFTAFLMYPDVIDRLTELEAVCALLHNRAVVSAYVRAGLPLYQRLDHDVADSRGILCGIRGLERAWLPALARAIEPAVSAGFTLLWHCDGNLMELVPRLIDCGVNGFQGFQYEDGMDYAKICRMRALDGRSMVIIAGVSVTRELPMGTAADVRRQMRFLVENGPEVGLILGFSSSCVPGTPWTNIETAIQGFRHYREHGR